MAHEAGKGDTQRPTDYQKFAENFERIFGKPKEKRLVDMTEEDFNEALGIKPEQKEQK
jgi:hypothetical protein